MIRRGAESFSSAVRIFLSIGIASAMIASSYSLVGAQSAAPVTIHLTSGSSWAVPADWDPANNTIEVIGGGGGGADTTGIRNGGGGGGGGAYSKATNVNLPAGSTVIARVGAGGTGGQAGGDTYVCNSSSCSGISDAAVRIGAKGGGAGSNTTGGTGGQASGGVGSEKYSGGNGGNGRSGDSGAGGGGGAAGPSGNGARGGNSGGDGGGGGGGANTGGPGANSRGDSGAAGGPNRLGGGAGAANSGAGSNGGGGGGARDASGDIPGGPGGAGTEWGSRGAGGGGGGGGDDRSRGGNGGLYGGGGGGTGSLSGGGAPGASGASGLIIITYVPKPPEAVPPPTCSVTFDSNPIQDGESTTIRWTSTGADTFYINTLGYVSASGEAQVSPSQTTDYDGTVSNVSGTGSCDALLSVGQEAPQCIQNCPVGYTAQNGQCVLTSCPAGYEVRDGQCVSVQCPVALVDDTGCTAGSLQCVGDEVWSVDAFCEPDSFVRTCPHGCSSGGCLLPSHDGNISASPRLVSPNERSTVTWTTNGMVPDSCIVVGENGDTWNGNAGSQLTSQIESQTRYTLSCTALDGSTFTDSVLIQMLPYYQEV